MEKQKIIERQEHGWFKRRPRSYAPLLKSDSVQMLAQTFTPKSRANQLYSFNQFLEVNSLGPDELLSLSDTDIKKCIRKAIFIKREEKHYAQARKMFYIVRRFLELNDREVHFNRTEKKVLLKLVPKKNGREYIPTRDDIYRIVDAFPDKGKLQKKRGKALMLCLWQSGVRSSCICSWTYGMFKNQLYPTIKAPIAIKVLAHREPNIHDCAEDTKLSSYAVNYYYTFINNSASEALKDYLEERTSQGWQPKDGDPVFVTHATVKEACNKPLTPQHIVEIVKNGAKQIGIEPKTIWTHCLRKAFRKTMYASGVDPDIAEALMGHKLPASRGSYFDYHDLDFARKNYLKANWARINLDRLREMEENIDKIVEERVKKIENFYEQEYEKDVGSIQKQINELRKMLEEDRERDRAPKIPQPKIVTKAIQKAFRDMGKKVGEKIEET